MIKALKKVGIEGTFINIIKAIYNIPIANIICNGEKQTIFSKIKKEALNLPTLSQHSAEIPSQSNKTGGRCTRDLNREIRSQIALIYR
jgi:hypothetical protein